LRGKPKKLGFAKIAEEKSKPSVSWIGQSGIEATQWRINKKGRELLEKSS
jgi:hypothetical protein